MAKPKHIFECLDSNINSEVYTSDNRKRVQRANQGQYSRDNNIFDFIKIMQNWPVIVGKLLGQNTLPLKIQKDTLVVVARHAIFAQELGLMSPIIIQKLGENFPALKKILTKIKFVHSEEAFKTLTSRQTSQPKTSKSLHPFSPEFIQRKTRADELFKDIEDTEIKKLFCELYLQNS